MKFCLAFLLCCLGLTSAAHCAAAAEETLAVLSCGDRVCRLGDTLILTFAGARDVLSSSLVNGGYRRDLQAVLNHRAPDDATCMTADCYIKNMRKLSCSLGYDPDRVSAMGTGVPMKNAVVKSERYRDLTVTAIATAGAQSNPGRAGDPAPFYAAAEKLPKPGTINLIVHLDATLPPGVLTRALVTATEAKTAALQELAVGSNYSHGLATGTGTDQIIAVANPEASCFVEDTGKHSKAGELIGRTVKAAVKEALYLQNGFCGENMHAITRRMARFGLSEEKLYADYRAAGRRALDETAFRRILQRLDRSEPVFVSAVLYAHLLDQRAWNLLSAEETGAACRRLLAALDKEAASALPQAPAEEDLLLAWERALLRRIEEEAAL